MEDKKKSHAERMALARSKKKCRDGKPKFKVTQTMRDTIEEVWNRLQVGTNEHNAETSLYAIASSDPKWFYELIKGMFPKNLFVEAEVNNTFAGLTIEQLIDIATTSSTGSGDDSSEG